MAALAINTASNSIDRQKFRQEYLNELSLRSALDQQTYNGTILYQKTGIPPTAPADLTSVSDRMSSVENNKIALRQALLAITDMSNAERIINSLPTTSLDIPTPQRHASNYSKNETDVSVWSISTRIFSLCKP